MESKNKLMEVIRANSVDDIPVEHMNILQNGSEYDSRIARFLRSEECKVLVSTQNWETLANKLLSFYKITDSGRYGKVTEFMTRLYIMGRKGRYYRVSPAGVHDYIVDGRKVEVKTNCGELAFIWKSNVVFYTAHNEIDYAEPYNVRVIDIESFINGLFELNLVRLKKRTDGHTTVSIQSYKNSKKKHNAWMDFLEQFPTLEEVFKD